MTRHLRLLLHSVAQASTHLPCLHERFAGQSGLYVHFSSFQHSVRGCPLNPLRQLQIARWFVAVQSAFVAQDLSMHGSTHWRFVHAKLFGHCESVVHLVARSVKRNLIITILKKQSKIGRDVFRSPRHYCSSTLRNLLNFFTSDQKKLKISQFCKVQKIVRFRIVELELKMELTGKL